MQGFSTLGSTPYKPGVTSFFLLMQGSDPASWYVGLLSLNIDY